MNGGKTEPTAHAIVRSVNCQELPLQSYADFMDALIYIFRLVSGTGVEWYYGEAFGAQTHMPTERIHKFAMHGPFSKVFGIWPQNRISLNLLKHSLMTGNEYLIGTWPRG